MKLIHGLAGLLVAAACCSAVAVPLLVEGFDDVRTLPASGWVLINNSAPPGTTGWFQGDPAIFPAAAGPADAYLAANFNNAAYGGAVSNWLLTPEVALVNGESLNFSLRLLGEGLLDRVEVYFSPHGASTDVGAGFALLGAFEADADTGWQERTVLVNGLAAPASGRFGFRYVVDDTSLNGNYVGLDSVSINAIPEPSTVALVCLGAIALGSRRLRRRWLAAGGLAGVALAAHAAHAATADDQGVMRFPHVQVVAQPATAPAPLAPDGLMAYKDPVTGQLTGPTAEQSALLTAKPRGAAPLARQASPQVTRAAHGGVRLRLDERHARYAMAHKQTDGSVSTTCEPAPGDQP
ncbi:hypothetical protein FHW58_001457 [Duganella sp. 1224]|uniref:choice-of-anchor J family PEP-CTERM protein n=1 Tax=Duganella sp. 1224 TaxID=2587052 RepID=UPI0015CAC45E|nr:choice-of-anchor J domain-containing protein [Duganella sp. 1224]NYE60305.1 hypothetical protein [Duganella sp. 1224]